MSMLIPLAACGGNGGSSSQSSSASDTLTIATANGVVGAENNNPWSADSSAGKMNYIQVLYDSIMVANRSHPAEDHIPWLATKEEWSADHKTVKYTARKGVKWSDGKDFTADDIAFTFDIMKKFPATDLQALQPKSTSVSGDVATIEFGNSMYAKQATVANTKVVPKHIWESVKDPVKDKNLKPVGTGPYSLKNYSSQSAVLTARKDYWHGEVAAKTLNFVSYSDNISASNALEKGEADVSNVFIPNVKTAYLDKSPDNHFYAEPVVNNQILFVNTTKAPFNDVVFRRAINMVLDRQQFANVANEMSKDLVLKNITGIPEPSGTSFIPAKYKGKSYAVDVAGAKKLLEANGYSYQGDKLIGKDGKQVSFNMEVPQGWSDFVSGISVLADNVKKLGVDAKMKTPDTDTWNEDLNTGNFDALLRWSNVNSSSIYDNYADTMDGAALKPIGETATGNFGRYDNKEVTGLLDTYLNATDDKTRNAAMEKVIDIYVDQVPAFMVGESVQKYEFSTAKFTGWPTEENPYYPENGYIYTQIKKVAK